MTALSGCRFRHLRTAVCLLGLSTTLLFRTQATAADGFWILGPDLGMTGQTNWFFYNGADAPEGAYMGWLFAGITNTPGVIDLKRTLPAGQYFVLLKLIDYSGNGQFGVVAGSGSGSATTTNTDWNRYWTGPIPIQTTQSFSKLTVNLSKTIAVTDVQKYVVIGLYITTNANENVPLYGYDRIVNWAYPTGTNSGFPVRGNLIENGSFEVGIGHGWGFMAEGADREFPISSLLNTNLAFDGTSSLTFPVKGRLTSKIYKVKPNRLYTLSAWVRSAAPSGINIDIYNIGTPPPGLPAVQDIRQTFLTTTSWTRISMGGFLPAYPDCNYQIGMDVWPGVTIDAIQLEETAADSPATFRTRSAIEIGFTSDKPGRILYEDENPALNLLAYNSTTGAFSGTISFEIFDVFNQKILKGETPLSISAKSNAVQTLSLPTRRGIFRLLAWVKGVEGSLEETVYSVVPRPHTNGVDETSVIGVSPNLMPFELAIHQRLGFKWARAMSPEAIFRWSLIEPVEGQIAWYDDKVNRATNYGMTIMGTIGSNDYWPAWANTNGMPDLDKWQTFVGQLVTHYQGRVRYWEIWNEPLYTFTPAFYAEMMKRAATAIRSADPSAKIVGMGGSYDVNWILQVMQNLGTNWSQYQDVIATHLYPPYNDPTLTETDARNVAFKQQVIDTYGVEVWNTETGAWDQGFYKSSNSDFAPGGEAMRPYLDSERYFQGCYYEAESMLVNFLHCLGNGLTKYFYYDSRIFADPSYLRSHPTMLEYDDTIRSKGIAYSIAAYFLDGSRGLGSVSPSTNTTYAYLFGGASNSTVVIWSKDLTNHSIQLGGTGWRAYDLMGNLIAVTNSTLFFGRTPVYVQSDSLTTNTMRTAFQNATVSSLSDTVSPNISIDEFPTGPSSQANVSIRWLGIDETSIPSPANETAMTYSYMLQGRDTNWSAWTPATQVTLPTGSYTFQVRARDAAGNISSIESRTISGTLAPPKNLGITSH